ncbi:MAG: radical SAM protein [Deltaproteobacteria bacterium]|nr:MAG: radical SAM protein [Deltaproteobacteria bacterium]
MPQPRIALVSAVDAGGIDPTGDHRPFSYAARKLEASLRADPTLEGIEVRVFDLETLEVEPFFEALSDYGPTLVGATAYVWSLPTFLRLAARLKAERPEVVFVLGGPSARASVMRLEPYAPYASAIDALVPGEGEQIIRDLARLHLGGGWQALPGLLRFDGTKWVSTGPAPRPLLDAYPTPYHLGLAPPGTSGYVETFRGCPIHCTFCQWGDKRADRVYSRAYLAEQLAALKEGGVRDLFFLDAGFNLSARGFRNLIDAEREVGLFASCHAYGHVYPTHLKPEHVDAIAAFERVQLAVGIQSFDPAVLAEVQRPFDMGRFERMLEHLRGRMSLSMELILGLPGDRPESFKRTFERTVALADTVRVYWCLVLPDALLDRQRAEQAIRFDPVTWRLVSCATWSERELEETWAWLCREAESMPQAVLHPTWVGFATTEHPVEYRYGAPVPRRDGSGWAAAPVEAAVMGRLRRCLSEGAGGWALLGARREGHRIAVELGTPEGALHLVAEPDRADLRRFRSVGGVAYWHRGRIGRAAAAQLSEAIDLLHPEITRLVGRS